MKRIGQEVASDASTAWSIQNQADLDRLIYDLTPAHERQGLEPKQFRISGNSFVRSVFELLWSQLGKGVNVDKLCAIVGANGQWSDRVVATVDTSTKMRARFLKRMNRLNEMISKTRWRETAFLKYDKAAARIHLILTRNEVDLLTRGHRNRRLIRNKQRTVAITISSRFHHHGLPILKIGDSICFSLMSDISGYLHVLHVDGNGQVDRMLPFKNVSKYVTARKPLNFPKDVFPLFRGWKVAKTIGKRTAIQKLVVVVTAVDVSIKGCDLAALDIPNIGRGVIFNQPSLLDLRKGAVAKGIALYEYRSSDS